MSREQIQSFFAFYGVSGTGQHADRTERFTVIHVLVILESGYVTLYRLQQDTALDVAVRYQKEVGYQPS